MPEHAETPAAAGQERRVNKPTPPSKEAMARLLRERKEKKGGHDTLNSLAERDDKGGSTIKTAATLTLASALSFLGGNALLSRGETRSLPTHGFAGPLPEISGVASNLERRNVTLTGESLFVPDHDPKKLVIIGNNENKGDIVIFGQVVDPNNLDAKPMPTIAISTDGKFLNLNDLAAPANGESNPIIEYSELSGVIDTVDAITSPKTNSGKLFLELVPSSQRAEVITLLKDATKDLDPNKPIFLARDGRRK